MHIPAKQTMLNNKPFGINPCSEIALLDLGDITDTYHLPKRKRKCGSQTWVRKNCPRIDSIRNYSMLYRQIEGSKDQFFIFYDRHWRAIKQLSDFPKQTPKEILTLYLLYQGGA